MKKKTMALMLSAAMAISMLSGCGGNDSGSDSQVSESQGAGRVRRIRDRR